MQNREVFLKVTPSKKAIWADSRLWRLTSAERGKLMRRGFVVVMVVLSLASLPAAGMPATPLTTLHAVHVLTNTEADKGLPVAFEATVGYSRWYDNGFFANDGGEGLYVLISPAASFTPGDHVFIRDTTHGSFRPLVNASSVTLLRHGPPPTPLTTS